MAKAGRKRKLARVEYRDGQPARVEKGGTEIEGLSYDPSIKSYYTRVGGRKKNLGRDLAAAIVKLQDEADLPAKVKVSFELDRPLSLRELSESTEAVGAKLKAAKAALATENDKPPAAPQKLSDCLRFWTEWKAAEACRQSYIDETERCFSEFIAEVGDKPVNHLAKPNFVGFERYLIRGSKGRKGNDWYARRLKSLRAVLNLCYQKTEYPFPADLWRWYDAIEKKPVVPAKGSAEPLPANIFRAMLATLREWAVIDVEAMPKATQSDKAKRNRAYDRKRTGAQWQAILSLACNASLGNEDICCITWDNLKLRAKLPHMDFPRTKQEKKVGRAIERKTPLLPSTIQALREWRRYEPTNSPWVFRNSRKGQWVYDDISTGFGRIKRAAKHGSYWSFKHLRNVGSTVRFFEYLPKEMSKTILGDSIGGTDRFYTGEANESYLVPLVNLIGETYFDGEQVGTK